ISGQRSTNNSHLRRSCVPLTLVHGAFPPRTEANQQLGVPRIVTFKQLPKPPGRKSAQETHFVFRSRKCAIGVSSRNLRGLTSVCPSSQCVALGDRALRMRRGLPRHTYCSVISSSSVESFLFERVIVSSW